MQNFLGLVAQQNMDGVVKSRQRVSDIVQNSLIRIVERFDSFNGSTSIEFRGWLKQIVVNEIKNCRRALKTRKRDVTRENALDAGPAAVDNSPTDPAYTPASQAIASERIKKFHEVLQQLSPDHAAVIRMRNIERLAFKEIAEKLERSEDAVSKLWYRAILNFEEKLGSVDEI